MTTYTKAAAFIAVLALSAGTTIAYAQGPQNGERPMPGPGARPATMWQNGTPGMRSGSSTDDRPGPRMGSTTDMMRAEGFRGIPGVVTAVASDHFLMTSRGLGRDTASTTLTVNVGSTTQYFMGSSTASLASVTVGAKVEVLGKIATSTKTITADRVRIGNDEEFGNRMMRGDDASTTERVRDGSFLEKLKSFFGSFGKKGPQGGPAAVSESGDFLGGVMNSLFGWLH